MAFRSRLNKYYQLIKPGIIYGNLLTATAGFLLACRWRIDWWLLLATLSGIALVIGSSCVFNNYLDRGIDAKMARTRKRALVQQTISARAALTYGTALGLLGFADLILFVNLITFVLGAIGFIDYVILYGLSKRRFSAGTIVGSISGAMPIAAGYTAVTDHFNLTTLLLLLIMVCWQMPHFYAIAIYRYKDYKAAGLPVLTVVRNIQTAKQRIVVYIVGFIFFVVLLKTRSGVGYIYLILSVAAGLYWLYRGLKTYRQEDDAKWGKQMFLTSLIVVLALSAGVAFGSLLS